jgi:hypothetical protein
MEPQVGVEEVVDQNSQENSKFSAVSVKCVCCGDLMRRDDVPRFNRGFGVVLVIAGVLGAFFLSLFAGLPLVVFGAYMIGAYKNVWKCQTCGAAVERVGP